MKSGTRAAPTFVADCSPSDLQQATLTYPGVNMKSGDQR